ncbi:hypothetical protein [Bacillus songklensis]
MDINEGCAGKGAQEFRKQWPQILYEIRYRICSNAEIYVMTVYNPYKGNDPNYSKTNHFIQQINGAIQNPYYKSIYNYKVVDVSSSFRGQWYDGTWKVCAWTNFCSDIRDPHPNDCGHQEIYRLHRFITD